MHSSAGCTDTVKFFIAMVALSTASVIWAGDNKDAPLVRPGSGGPPTETLAATGSATAPGVSQEEIKKLIAQLGDKDFKVREAATIRLVEIGKPALLALRDVVKNNVSDSEAVERAKIIIRFAPDSGDIVDGLQGVIRAKDSKVKAGEDIQVEFKLQAVDKAVVVWDGTYSNGYRNHSFEVRTPDGKTEVLRPKLKEGWNKNAPHPVEITKDKPYVLPGWFEGVTFKSLKTLGLDTSKPGKYVITGRYEEVGGVEGNVKIWGGSIATNSITVEVEP